MSQPSAPATKYRVVVKAAEKQEVIARDLSRDQAAHLRRSISAKFPQVTIEEQSEGENSLIRE